MDGITVDTTATFKEILRKMSVGSPCATSSVDHRQCPNHWLHQSPDLNDERDKIHNTELESLHDI